jgi:hypothetical protein
LYVGKYKQGFFNGYGTYLWKSGSNYKGNFKQGQMHGFGKLFAKTNDKNSTYEG